MTFSYSRGKSKYDNCPAQLEVKDFDEFANAIAEDRSAEKGLTYICSALSEGIHYVDPAQYPGTKHWRLSKYGLARQYLAFDFDGFESTEVFHQVCELLQTYNCIIYTTASHTDEAARARAFIELSREVASEEGEILGQAAQIQIELVIGLDRIKFDKSVYRATQPIYTPVTNSIIFRHHGAPLDVDKVLDKYSPSKGSDFLPAQRTSITPIKSFLETPEAVSRMESALSAIPADIEREIWCKLLYSVKAHGFSCCEDKAREWSKSAGEYDQTNNPQGYQEKVFDDVWKYPVQSISPGTLYHHAKRYGWIGVQGELFPPQNSKEDIEIYGDVFNGKFFKKVFEDRMIYCYPRSKWLKFNGMYWQWCESGEELQAAKEVAKEIAKYAGERFGQDPINPNSKKLTQHAQNSQNLNRLHAMLETAASEIGMGIGNMNELDKDAMLLGCKNGVICLNTGTLLAPNPAMLITRQVNANYNLDSKCPTWLKFLNECFMGNEETITYIQKALGYSLTGLVKEEVLHFCFGMGRNGKSVFANVITKLMGDYAITAPAEMLMCKDRNGPNNDIARLCGSRLVLANETRSDQRFDDLTIKTLVSTERIAARFLYSELFEFWPSFKIWIRGNHKPLITDESNGAWRRIRLVPFENNLSEDKVDSNLESKLLAEKEGILAWMVQGTLKWNHEGLDPSSQIKVASNQYRDDCDVIGEFVRENYVLSPNQRIAQSTLWEHWKLWTETNGYRHGGKRTFTRRLKERGIDSDVYLGKVRAYGGIGNLA